MKQSNRSYRQTGILAFAIVACLLVRSMAAQETTFEDVTAAVGLGGGDFVAWADYDDDGDVDLVTGGYLFKNDGQGQFRPLDGFSASHGVWADYDNDGRLDYYATGEGDVELCLGP